VTAQARPRRAAALSRERIVAAAVELLDSAGAVGLTFKALTERLATGPGAIYHHVASKDELLAAATGSVVAAVLPTRHEHGPADPPVPSGTREPAGPTEAADAIRAAGFALFDAIHAHPWLAGQLATQLAANPWGPVTTRIFESVGGPVRALGTPESGWFAATSVLVHYILGAAGQHATNAMTARPGVDRVEFLDTAATAWAGLDPREYPFTRAIADQLREHDDREQFVAGIDLVLAGLATR
jgi:AcrR family transcriptional regulator